MEEKIIAGVRCLGRDYTIKDKNVWVGAAIDLRQQIMLDSRAEDLSKA